MEKKLEWLDIENVNKEIKTIDVKGKQYAEVNKRVIAFRKLMPSGVIATNIVSREKNDEGYDKIIMNCEVFDDNGKLLAKAHSYEIENMGYINKTSYIENCETSVVGRALGLCGIGIDNAIASFEEVDIAIQKQDLLKTPASEMQLDMIQDIVSDLPALLKYYKISKLEDLTTLQAETIIKKKGNK